MADNRYGRDDDWRDRTERDRDRQFTSGYGRDYDPNRSYGSPGYGGYGQQHDRDNDRNRGYGAYSQGGSYGQPSSHRDSRASAYDRSGRDNERYDNYDEDRRVAVDETDRLIASNKVEGTRVYNRRGERLGTIYNFMVDKRLGRVEYAVMSFGGFLGLGERYYPLPWQVLTYDERQGGYIIDIQGDERDLAGAPSFRPGEEPRFDRAYGQRVYGFYGLTY